MSINDKLSSYRIKVFLQFNCQRFHKLKTEKEESMKRKMYNNFKLNLRMVAQM